MKLFHIVLWSLGSVVTSINVKAETELQALSNARCQYPHYTPTVTMTKDVEDE